MCRACRVGKVCRVCRACRVGKVCGVCRTCNVQVSNDSPVR